MPQKTDLALPTDQCRTRLRKHRKPYVHGPERPEISPEIGRCHLEDQLGAWQVPELMLAEKKQADAFRQPVLYERPGGLRNKDLSAMARFAEPGGSVHVEANSRSRLSRPRSG